MIRFALLLIYLMTAIVWAKTDIDGQLRKTSAQIKTFDKKYSTLNVKMAKNAKAILKQKRSILKQQKQLQQLMLELGVKEENYETHKADLKKARNSQSSLSEEQNKIEHELVFSISSNASLSMLLDDKRVISADSLITEEILKNLTRQTQQEIAGLHNRFSSNTERIAILEERISELKNAIAEIEYRRKELVKTQKSNEEALKKLQKDKRAYKVSVEKLLSQQNALQKTLVRLHIVKEDQKKKARERARAKRERARRAKARRAREASASNDLPDVKKIGSSYQNIKTKRYRGRKTIAPLDGYKLVKKFGPYTDPIYKLKIFNESVSLKPKQQNAKVKNVLNGKVILAQNTALLNNVIIIEHDHGIHTIYAHLEKIAPTVKKGKKVKKGSVIGRVRDELMFEVTQKTYHINPMQLIY